MPLETVMDWLDELDNLLVWLIVFLGTAVSGWLLGQEGLRHMLQPASSTLANWLGEIGLQVGQLGFSFGGVLAALVALVGAYVFMFGVVILLAAGFLIVQQVRTRLE